MDTRADFKNINLGNEAILVRFGMRLAANMLEGSIPRAGTGPIAAHRAGQAIVLPMRPRASTVALLQEVVCGVRNRWR